MRVHKHIVDAVTSFLGNKELRIGQALWSATPNHITVGMWNKLSVEDKSKIDCFYDDSKCYDYLVWCHDEESVNEVYNLYNLKQYYNER